MTINNDEMYWTMFIWLGLLIGSIVGGYIPILWGGSLFSIASILCGTVGGLFGISAGYKISLWLS